MRDHSYENEFDLHENKTACRTHFHKNGFAQIGKNNSAIHDRPCKIVYFMFLWVHCESLQNVWYQNETLNADNTMESLQQYIFPSVGKVGKDELINNWSNTSKEIIQGLSEDLFLHFCFLLFYFVFQFCQVVCLFAGDMNNNVKRKISLRLTLQFRQLQKAPSVGHSFGYAVIVTGRLHRHSYLEKFASQTKLTLLCLPR